MLRPTLSMLRNSAFPQRAGICADNLSQVAAVANECQQRLIYDPLAPDEGWHGSSIRMRFNVTVSGRSATIITPNDVARIIVLDICKVPRQLRNGFYEYLQFGTGLKPPGCDPWVDQVTQAFARDNVATLAPFPTSAPQTIWLFPGSSSDVGKRVVIQGPDKNGKTVLGLDPTTGEAILGEQVALQFPSSLSLNQFQGITGILKDVTVAPVTIMAIDSVTNATTALSTMEPHETTAAYRQYFLNGLPANCCTTPGGVVQIDVQAKIDFVPVVSDRDYLTIPNIPALIEEGQSLHYSEMDTETAAKLEAKHHAKALALLNGQIDHYEGKVNTAIGLKIFGSAKLRPQPK